MKLKVYSLIILSLLVFTGCVEKLTTRQPSTGDIDTLIAKQFYGKALDAMFERQKRSPNPAYISRINNIRELADTYDEDQSATINALINKHEWIRAKEKLDNALYHYPKGKQLLSAQKRYLKQRNLMVLRLKAQHLLAKADWQLRALRIQNSLKLVLPESNGAFDSPHIRQADINETAIALYQLGKLALNNQYLDMADSCLTMSDRLRPDGKTSSAMAQVDQLKFKQKQAANAKAAKLAAASEARKQRIAQRRVVALREYNKKKHKIKQKANQREFTRIYYETRSLLDSEQLSRVPGNLAKMKSLSSTDPRFTSLREEYYQKLPTHIEALLNRGKRLYINGKIKKAREIWQKAHKLDPGNKQVNNNIARADRVLGRLDELKKKRSN